MSDSINSIGRYNGAVRQRSAQSATEWGQLRCLQTDENTGTIDQVFKIPRGTVRTAERLSTPAVPNLFSLAHPLTAYSHKLYP